MGGKGSIRRVLVVLGQLGKWGATAARAGISKLPASRAGQALDRLLLTEIEDPSGRAEINRAGLSFGLAFALVLFGLLLKDGIVTIFGGEGEWWRLPALGIMVLCCMGHSLACAKILTE